MSSPNSFISYKQMYLGFYGGAIYAYCISPISIFKPLLFPFVAYFGGGSKVYRALLKSILQNIYEKQFQHSIL